MEGDVTVYGSSWCGYTRRTVGYLDQWGVEYRYIEVDDDPEAERLIASWNNGRSIRPTLSLQGDVFVNPDPRMLEQELRSRGLMT